MKTFILSQVSTLVLIVVGFLTPPPGDLTDNQVYAIYVLFGYAVLAIVHDIVLEIRNGKSLSIRNGDLEVKVDSNVSKK